MLELAARLPILSSGPQIALEQQADNPAFAGAYLREDISADESLPSVILGRISMGAVHHDRPRDALSLEELGGARYVRRAVIRTSTAAA